VPKLPYTARGEDHGSEKEEPDELVSLTGILVYPPKRCLVNNRREWMDVEKVMAYQDFQVRFVGKIEAAGALQDRKCVVIFRFTDV
jgi:hypothetical protein